MFFSKCLKKFVESDQRELILKQNIIEKENEKIANEMLYSNKMLGLSNFEELNSNDKQDNEVDEDPFSLTTDNPEFSLSNIKEIIYKTYSKVIDNSNDQTEINKSKIKSILDLIIHIQMKKLN